MRAYKLVISKPISSIASSIGGSIGSALSSGLSQIAGSSFVVEQNEKQPSAPNIKFNIQHYFGTTIEANASIYLSNMPDYFYGQYANLYNKKVQLYAGFYKSPLISKIGYQASCNLIYNGYVTSVIPDYSGLDKTIQLICQPVPFFENSAIGINARKQVDRFYTFTIKKGMPAITLIKQAFTKITDGLATLTIKGIINPIAFNNIDTTVYTIYDLVGLCSQQFKLSLSQSINGYILANADSVIAVQSKTHILKTSDFLTQPESIEKSLALKLYMRGGIHLLDTVLLPPNIFVGLNSFSQNYVINSALKGMNLYSLYSGKFKVTKVWQIGDSRNNNAEAWATNLEAIPI